MNTLEYINNYLDNYRNYKDYWNYEDGCILNGCRLMYAVTGEKRYIDFIISYLNPLINDDGTIANYETGKHNIDSFNAGKALFAAYDETHEERFRRAIDFLIEQLHQQPRIPAGSFWHKGIYENQVWLDGLYMAQPFYMEYETRFNKKENYNDILTQFRNVRKFLYDKNKHLYYHGYDDAKIQPWADKQTGKSSNFWLRSMGWLLMALTDVIGAMSKEIYEQYREYCDLLKEALDGILAYRDEKTGLFLQVIDKPQLEGNYAETSGSAMVAYTILKACADGVLDEEKYEQTGIDIFNSIVKNKLICGGSSANLCDICWVAGLGPGEKRDGSAEYYVSEERVADDPKGVGPFIMAYAAKLMSEKEISVQGGYYGREN